MFPPFSFGLWAGAREISTSGRQISLRFIPVVLYPIAAKKATSGLWNIPDAAQNWLHVSGIRRFLPGRARETAAAAHTLAQLCAFLGSHLLPAFPHRAPPRPPAAWPAA